jgi:predicted GNAT family N-acyltransferase
MGYIIAQLNKLHDKKTFCCGNEMLDNYLKKQARQDIERKLSLCFILTQYDDLKKIIGYYTLSSSSIDREQLSEEIIKKMPPGYKNLPVTLLGRLARDISFRGKDIGNILLIDALKKSYEVSVNSIASMAVIVDPFDEQAKVFYSKYGFIQLDSGKMFLLMDTISQLFK